MLSESNIISISNNYFRELISKKLEIDITYIHTIMLIGSCVQPETMRKKSDLDIVFFIDDEYCDDPKNFKASYQTNRITENNQEIIVPVDIKIYTLSSFKQEMYHDSLTRIFAILNAYKIIFSTSDSVMETLYDASERMRLHIEISKDNLKKLNIINEAKNLENYFTDALSILSSEKLKNNLTLSHLRLYEYLKEFIIQFQRVLYAKDLQDNNFTHEFDEYIKNLLIFKNPDGTRLLDDQKYRVDYRVKELVSTINSAIAESDSLKFEELVNSLFTCFNNAFIKNIGYPVINNKERYEYFLNSTKKNN